MMLKANDALQNTVNMMQDGLKHIAGVVGAVAAEVSITSKNG